MIMLKDPVLFWNHLCNEANKFDHTSPMQGMSQGGPTRSSRATAMVHLVIHDAFFGIEGSHPKYVALAIPAPANNQKNLSSAVSGAAHTCLTALYPHQQKLFDDGQLEITVSNGVDNTAFEYGRSIAFTLLALRQKDGADEAKPPYVYSHAKPHHRSDPLNSQLEPLGAHWGEIKPFAVNNITSITTPPAISSPEYKADHDEVRLKGGASSQSFVTRTAE